MLNRMSLRDLRNIIYYAANEFKRKIFLNSTKISADCIAIQGKNNFLFLFEGFNRYYQMYFDRKHDVRQIVRIWEECLDSWEKSVEQKSSLFHFVLVPNKASILKELYPLHLPFSETPHMAQLRQTTKVQIFKPKDKWDVFRKMTPI